MKPKTHAWKVVRECHYTSGTASYVGPYKSIGYKIGEETRAANSLGLFVLKTRAGARKYKKFVDGDCLSPRAHKIMKVEVNPFDLLDSTESHRKEVIRVNNGYLYGVVCYSSVKPIKLI